MKDRKGYVKGFRVTGATDQLIDRICQVCNNEKYNAKINGNEDVTCSSLVGFLFEKIAHGPGNKEEELSDLLFNILKLKNRYGQQMTIEEVKQISREVINGN